MAKPRTFKSNTGSPVVIYRPDLGPLEVPYYAPHYETSDPVEIDALVSSPEVVEVQPRKASK